MKTDAALPRQWRFRVWRPPFTKKFTYWLIIYIVVFSVSSNLHAAGYMADKIDWFSDSPRAGSVVTSTVGKTGGVVESPSIGSVWFPDDSFDRDTSVSLKATQEKLVNEWFDDTTVAYRIANRGPQEIRIGLGESIPRSETINVDLKVPTELYAQLKEDEKIEVFASFEQGGEDESPFTIFEIVDSIYTESTKTLQFQLPAATFAKNELTQGEYQAIIIIGTLTKIKQPSLPSGAVSNLIGMDADSDGIRDDIGNFIASKNLSQSELLAAKQNIFALQDTLTVDLENELAVSNAARKLARSIDCIFERYADSDSSENISFQLESLIFNTESRALRYISFNKAADGVVIQSVRKGACDEV
jgi:hypothetical protein